MNIEIPALDEATLKEAAAKSAMSGALAEIKEFYEGYNSPFRKKIKQNLKSKSFHFSNPSGCAGSNQ